MNTVEARELTDEIILLLINSDGGRPAPDLLGGILDRLDQIGGAFPGTRFRCAELGESAGIFFSERDAEYFDARGAAVSQAAGLLMALKAERE